MSSTTVHVKNISHLTTENEVKEFFSFCPHQLVDPVHALTTPFCVTSGKITSISVTPASNDPESTKSATVTFEKETAAKTALLLDNTQLGPSSVQVSGAPGLDEIAPGRTAGESTDGKGGELDQEDKPRSRIIAEYLAQGYVVGDQAIQKAIELDKKHGFSHKFTSALQNFENKYHATDKARSMDTTYGVTNKANAGWRSLSHYFEKALGTPTGQRVRLFYTHSEKQAMDIHNEARRLANLRKADHEPAPAPQDTEKTT
ncbi:hypothetical protein GP486_007165, partial [Trichoglossum hirsutum]